MESNIEVQLAQRKLIARKFFIDLVNEFGFKRSSIPSLSIGKALVPPQPQPNCSDAEWRDYVNSIQTMPKKEESAWDKIKQEAMDPIKNSFLNYKPIKGAIDDWAFGSSKKGQILFTGPDGTMVLDRNIYRANVDRSEPDALSGENSGFAANVRDAMIQA